MDDVRSFRGPNKRAANDAPMPRFSIITVCKNEEQTIRRTCDSIRSQSFDAFEWIVVDGRSTDGTLAVLSEYASLVARLVSEPDDGIYDAMNKGIRMARGEYLLFLNAGDYFTDGEVLKEVSHAPGKDILYGDLLCMKECEESLVKTFPDDLPQYFLLQNMMPHQASFFRRELFAKYGDYDISFKIAGDYDLFVRYLYVEKVSSWHIPRTIAVFGTDGISSNPSQRILRKQENHHIRKKYFPWYVYGLNGLKTECKLRFAGG